MTQSIDPRLLYSESPLFLDVLEGKESATAFFEHSLASVGRMAEARQAFPDQETRSEICDALLEYNRMLDASAEAMGNIERLRTVNALCVIGGQQAGFLGGPLFIIYKIVSVIRTANWLSDRLEVPVVPIFWLASEDHDFAEINHTRWLDDSGALRTISFDWEEQGHAIEQMPMTEAVRHAFNEANRKISFSRASDAAIFKPEESDDYCRWHARIWSRLFSHDGLILVEPHVLRPLAQPFFMRALSEPNVIRAGLAQGAARLTEHRYPVPLDLSIVGTLFEISMDGKRQRIEPPLEGTAATIGHPPAETYSTDAALRPLLADSLLPTIANILGPSELAYHAMLCPLYKQWNIPQPLAIPRLGATVIPKAGFELLGNLGVGISEALHPEFKPTEVTKRLASDELRLEFSEAQARLEKALVPLKDHLIQLDPGLETRWRQTVDQVRHQVERLEDRAIRAELARRGISAKNLQKLKLLLRPMEKPQERVLSAFSFIANYGVKWIRNMNARGESVRFEHQLIVLEELNG